MPIAIIQTTSSLPLNGSHLLIFSNVRHPITACPGYTDRLITESWGAPRNNLCGNCDSVHAKQAVLLLAVTKF